MAGCCPRAAIGDAAAEFANHFDEIGASHVIRPTTQSYVSKARRAMSFAAVMHASGSTAHPGARQSQIKGPFSTCAVTRQMRWPPMFTNVHQCHEILKILWKQVARYFPLTIRVHTHILAKSYVGQKLRVWRGR
jgi:hypothetical protein